MNFDRVEILSFNDERGVQFPVRDIKPIDEYETGIIVEIPRGSFVDEVISRQQYYGNGTEDLSYQIVEHNKVKFAEANFDMSKIRKIDIPIIKED